ncbi:MAG: hypothetical protein EOM47_06540 [Bacteroidia bacterium]|nr:hypothetical protein [Bacteroidia bacterium]
MELKQFTELLWKQFNAAIVERYRRGERKHEPDLILVSINRLKEMRIAMGEMSVFYNPEYDMLRFRGVRILPDPTKSDDDFEILYNTNK